MAIANFAISAKNWQGDFKDWQGEMRTSLRSSRHCSEARFAVMFSSGCPKHLPNRPSGKAVPKHLPIQSVSAKPRQPKCRRHFSGSRYILAAVDSCVPWRASSRRRRSGDSRSPKCCCTCANKWHRRCDWIGIQSVQIH